MRKTILLFLVLFTRICVAQAQDTMQAVVYHEYSLPLLTHSSQQQLETMLATMDLKKITTVTLGSHTDQTGSREKNSFLSEERSLTVMGFLRSKLPATVVYDISHFGEDRPVTTAAADMYRNRRTELSFIFDEMTNAGAETVLLQPFIEDVSQQSFDINLEDTSEITAAGGTYLKILPGRFYNKKREIATGMATILLKEYYQPGDIMLSGMHSLSDRGMLQTGGMLKILVLQKNDTLSDMVRKPVLLRIPVSTEPKEGMTLFTTGHKADDSLWTNTMAKFRGISGRWNFPGIEGKFRDVIIDTKLPFTAWKVGRKWQEEYRVGALPPRLWFRKRVLPPYSKMVSFQLTKTDSVTLSLEVVEKFRRRGRKKFQVNNFDTSLLVKYVTAAYETETSFLNMINCDRFLDLPEVTNFYVKTPGYKGAIVMAYFKKLQAFLPAYAMKDGYIIKNVPPGEEVYIVGLGKKNDQYYFSRQPFTISKNATAIADMKQVEYKAMKALFQAFRL